MADKYYIYAHCRPSGEPFYIGKGHGKRAYHFNRGNNHHYHHIVDKYGKENILVYVYECNSEDHAFECERWMIAWCKSQGHNLSNMTEGGEGLSNPSEETRMKISIAQRGNKSCVGRFMSEETRDKIRAVHIGNSYVKGKKRPDVPLRNSILKAGNKYRLGKTFSEESRKKISDSLRGKPLSAEHRAKLSAMRKGKPKSAEHRQKLIEVLKRARLIQRSMRQGGCNE